MARRAGGRIPDSDLYGGCGVEQLRMRLALQPVGSRNLPDRQPRRMRGLDGPRSFALRLVPAKICGPQSFDEAAYALARRLMARCPEN